MRLNIGCGGKRIEGYTGVDAVERPGADIVAKADAIPLPDGSVNEIMAIHLFEHFYRWECDGVLDEWHRLLRPGGRLIMEMPDLMKTCKNVVDGIMKGGKEPDQLTLWSLYGDPRQRDVFMSHHWAWTPTSIKAILKEHGFIKVAEEPTIYQPAGREHRDMRIVCERA
mgnify:FL=1